MAGQTVAERLRDLRRRAGSPTQKAVAARLGCGYRSYQNWEAGRVTPRWKHAEALARFYETTPTFILHGVDEDGPTRAELSDLSDKLDQVLELVESLVSGEPAPIDRPASGGSTRRSRRVAAVPDRRLLAQEPVF